MAQYSVQVGWSTKIAKAILDISTGFPDVNGLLYATSQELGAKADGDVLKARKLGLYLDVRDRNFFLERFQADRARNEAAATFTRQVADPILASISSTVVTVPGLSADESKTALLFIEMQWRDENTQKSLTRSSFEALVRAALRRTDRDHRMSRAEVLTAVGRMMPSHSSTSLSPHVDAALTRLSKAAISHWQKEDEFHISFAETERLKDARASLALAEGELDSEISRVLAHAGISSGQVLVEFEGAARAGIERYFMESGEHFAASLTKGEKHQARQSDLRSIVTELAPKGRAVKGEANIGLLELAIAAALSDPNEAVSEYLRLLSQSHTLFAFLQETPDVQDVTRKMFADGRLWLDASVLLPVLAEEAFPLEQRPFTEMFKQCKAVGCCLLVTPGVLNELNSHLNLCVNFARASAWQGRVPFVGAQYLMAGGLKGALPSWIERFRGTVRPEDDIADYLQEHLGVSTIQPRPEEKLPSVVVAEVRDYWQAVNDSRRQDGSQNLNLAAQRLAEHDAENYLSVLDERREELGKSAFGFQAWWVTLDRAARDLLSSITPEAKSEIQFSPVMSLDYLLKYLAFGPRRDRVGDRGRSLAPLLAGAVMESLPQDLARVAEEIREQNSELEPRVMRRRIRDGLDLQRATVGIVDSEGLKAVAEGGIGTRLA